MKKLIALLTALVLLLAAFSAFAEGRSAGDDSAALTVNDHVVTRADLKAGAVLYMFEAAVSCASCGDEFDILDPENIAEEMDNLVYDLKAWYLTQDLAAGMGLYPLSKEAAAAAEEDAEYEWAYYCEVAGSDNGMAFLPAGNYQYVENDPQGNLVRYFASFGLTKETLLEEAVRSHTQEELKKAVTASLADQSGDAVTQYYVDWFRDRTNEAFIAVNEDIIAQVMDEMAEDPSENQDGDGYEAYERSIMINGIYYTLGESTIRDFERNGWTWKKDKKGRFVFQVTEKGNYFYARTDNKKPDGKLVMVDMFTAYDIAYEYLGIGFDQAYNPEAETDIYEVLEGIYGGDYTDDGVLQARTPVSGGTLLIEVGEYALRLTLE